MGIDNSSQTEKVRKKIGHASTRKQKTVIGMTKNMDAEAMHLFVNGIL